MARIVRMGRMGRSGIRPKGLEALNVYRDSRNTMQRSDRTFICSGCCDACEGQALTLRVSGCVFFGALRGTGPRATGTGAFFFRSAGVCLPRSLPHPGHPGHLGHPASDARAIKVLSDLFSLLRPRSIDMKVFQTFAPFAASSCSSC